MTIALPMPQPDVKQRLATDAEALGCVLTETQIDQLLAYLDLLAKWNKVYNLTAIRDPAQMVTQHLLDSLAVVAPLRRRVGDCALSLLDVGSGGGLPGVILAIVMPTWRVTCVDAVAKKAGFVQQVASELKLTNLASVHGRVERLGTGVFDVVTSRAFSSLIDFTQWTRAQLAPSGIWMAMKGRRPVDEIAELPASVDMFHVEQLQVPGLDAERCLIWMRPAT